MKDSFFTLTFFPRKPRAAGDGEYLDDNQLVFRKICMAVKIPE